MIHIYQPKFSALPMRHMTLGISLVFVTFIIVLPFLAVFWQLADATLSHIWYIITDERAVMAYILTVKVALFATVLNVVFGFVIAWVLTHYDFMGKKLLDASIDLPFALPTSVAGVALVALYDENGFMGRTLDIFGWSVAYTWVGIMIAMTFTSLPFGVRSVQPVLQTLNKNLEQAGASLGASNIQIFRHIIFPQVCPAFISGASVAFSRSLGEFGAIIFIAGNIPFETEIASLLIMIKLEEFDYVGAAAIATVILLFSLFILVITAFVQGRFTKRLRT